MRTLQIPCSVDELDLIKVRFAKLSKNLNINKTKAKKSSFFYNIIIFLCSCASTKKCKQQSADKILSSSA